MVKVIKVRIEDGGEGSIKTGNSYLSWGQVEVLEQYLGKLPPRPYMVEYRLEQNGKWYVDRFNNPKFLGRKEGDLDFPCCILNDLEWGGKRVTRRIV